MNAFYWLLVGFLLISCTASIYLIDKPRRPITRLDAIVSVLVNLVIIVWILIAHDVIKVM